MKTILVDAVNTFVIYGKGIFEPMHKLLETYPNKKIILTNANDEEFERFGLNKMPYEVFTLKHNPDKTDPTYYQIMLKHFNLNPQEVIYFEHNENAVKSAQKSGILVYHYDKDKQDLVYLTQSFDSKENKNSSLSNKHE
jgi:HAD superfamily hydrolase (TIGR01509 family)